MSKKVSKKQAVSNAKFIEAMYDLFEWLESLSVWKYLLYVVLFVVTRGLILAVFYILYLFDGEKVLYERAKEIEKEGRDDEN